MNERIKELAEQAGLILDGEHWFSAIQETDVRSIDLERFAELVRQDEREACAKVCNTQAQQMLNLIGLPVVTSEIIQRDRANQWSKCADAIRARSKHD